MRAAAGADGVVSSGRYASSVGTLERLPKWLNLVPILLQWLFLSLRYRSFSLPSLVNPAVLAGGLVGEGKLDYFALMGPTALAVTAEFTSLLNVGDDVLPAARSALALARLRFPIIAKPDIGWCGYGVRLIRNEAELARYLQQFPRGERVVLQRYMPQDGEAGLFYVRMPGDQTGRLIGILIRHFPRIVGDGVTTIAALIASDSRLRRLGRDGASEPCCDTARVPALGEVVRIATVGSTRVGGLYEDATPMITAALTASIDAIARDMPGFHLGRFDVRYDSLDLLAKGQGFTIIEVNGAGSEAVHAWDPKFTLTHAYRIIFEKQRLLFVAGDRLRREGGRPVGLVTLLRLLYRQNSLIQRYPKSN